ncbi:tetratricopeptide repeat protein [Riemerella anatipestifer]|nr:tetratricopeptide repeat protein [Riemerella anatipestifer]
MKRTLGTFFLTISLTIFAQENIDYLNEGNNLLNQNKPDEAELIFNKGLEKNPENLVLKSQVALAQMNQQKFSDAQETLNQILKADSSNIAALWYSGVNNYIQKPPKLREAIKYFELAYPLIDKNSGQYFGVNYFIGNSYKFLLYKEGLSYGEVDRMLETLKLYTKLQPNADDTELTANFIAKVEKLRPPKNVEKWIITTEKNASKVLKENLK